MNLLVYFFKFIWLDWIYLLDFYAIGGDYSFHMTWHGLKMDHYDFLGQNCLILSEKWSSWLWEKISSKEIKLEHHMDFHSRFLQTHTNLKTKLVPHDFLRKMMFWSSEKRSYWLREKIFSKQILLEPHTIWQLKAIKKIFLMVIWIFNLD